MKGRKIRKAAGTILAAAFAVQTLFLGAAAVPVYAADTAVSGTILSGSTPTMLYLKTSSGTMQILLDPSTDTSGLVMYLPDQTVTAYVFNGGNGFLKASKLMTGTTSSSTTVDTDTQLDLTGKVVSGTTDSILKLDTIVGTLTIRIDRATNLSNCSMLTVGQKAKVRIAKGSDNALYALSIDNSMNDKTASTSSGSSAVPASTSTTVSYIKIDGMVASGTGDTFIYLDTDGGRMILRRDSGAKQSLKSGQQITVYVYRGNDAYMHAASIGSEPTSNTVTQSNVEYTMVTGTIRDDSDSGLIRLQTSDGIYNIKVDKNTERSNFDGVIGGHKCTVTCYKGSDGYLHSSRIVNA